MRRRLPENSSLMHAVLPQFCVLKGNQATFSKRTLSGKPSPGLTPRTQYTIFHPFCARLCGMGCSLCSLTPKQNRLYHFFFGDPACFCSSLNYLYIPATVNKIEHLSFPSKSFFFLVVEPGSYAEKIARDWDYCYFYLNSYDWLDEELEEILQG